MLRMRLFLIPFQCQDPWAQGSGQCGDIRGNPRVRKEAEAAVNEHIRNVIEHFKQDDPVGLEKDLNDQIPDPMPIPNLDKDFSGVLMKFRPLSIPVGPRGEWPLRSQGHPRRLHWWAPSPWEVFHVLLVNDLQREL